MSNTTCSTFAAKSMLSRMNPHRGSHPRTPVMNAQSGAEYLLGEDVGMARMPGNFGDHA
jgi:hypothetical protein